MLVWRQYFASLKNMWFTRLGHNKLNYPPIATNFK